MPIAKLEKFREDVRQFLTIDAETQAGMVMDYVVNKAPEIAAIWPKVVENNEKLFTGEMTFGEVWSVVSREEMLILAGMLRHIFEQTAAIRNERNPPPPGTGMESVDADGAAAEWQIVPGASEEKVLMYLHGGGWILGSANSHRSLTVALGKATGMKVLSVNYRLAPENPFPAGLEDCAKTYRWLLGQGCKPSNIVMAGDSAGGNLTLSTILKLRDAGSPLPKGAVCLSPATNLEFDASFLARGQTDPILADLGTFWWISAYLGTENFALLKNPLVSPLFGDLRGFPPLLVQATPLELLFENGRQMVEKVKAAGGDATLQTWEGMVHVWQLVFVDIFPEAREAIDNIGQWVKRLYA